MLQRSKPRGDVVVVASTGGYEGGRRGRGGAGGWGKGAGNDRAAAENETQHEPTCNYCIIVH